MDPEKYKLEWSINKIPQQWRNVWPKNPLGAISEPQ